jgi:hypothetical protein
VEKYGRAGQATDNKVIRHMRLVYSIAEDTDSQNRSCVLLLHYNNIYANVDRCYLVRALPVFFNTIPLSAHRVHFCVCLYLRANSGYFTTHLNWLIKKTECLLRGTN